MCDTKLSPKQQEANKLKNLKVHQLFSVDILVEKIIVTHGPYKNDGDLDHVTESENSDDETKEEGIESDKDNGRPNEITVGLLMLDCDAHTPCDTCPELVKSQKTPRKAKKTSHSVCGTVDARMSRPWSGDCLPSRREPQRLEWKPYELCESCLQDCIILNRPEWKRSDQCTCGPRYCPDFEYTCDSTVTKKRSKLTLKRSQSCDCYSKPPGYDDGKRLSRDMGDLKQEGDIVVQREDESKDSPFQERGDGETHEPKDKDKKDKGGSREKDKGGSREKGKGGSREKGKGAKDKDKKGHKGKGKHKTPASDAPEPPPPPPPRPKPRWKKKCVRPPPPDGPLPPLRVSVSLFHIKDVKINQVDLDKLYPPQDDDLPPYQESDLDQELELGHKVSIENPAPTEKPKKDKSKKSLSKSSSVGKKGKEPSKKSVSSKPSKEKASGSMSKSSSKNVVHQDKLNMPIDQTQLNSALINLKHSKDFSDPEENNGLSKYRDLGGWAANKCSGDLPLKQKMMLKNYHLEKERRKEVIASLRGATDFKRGLSFVFSATPYDIITRLLVDKLEIAVERCGVNGPVYPIGKVKIRLPALFRDRVQAGSRAATMKPLWTCLEDNYPIIDCKGNEVGTLSLYFCLTSLGRAMVSTSLLSEGNLYDFTDMAYYIGQGPKGTAPEPRATAFKMCYGNLQQVNLKEYDSAQRTNLKLQP